MRLRELAGQPPVRASSCGGGASASLDVPYADFFQYQAGPGRLADRA